MGTDYSTFGQAYQILGLFQAKRLSSRQTEALLRSGLLSDLMEIDVTKIQRNKLREFLQLPKLKAPRVFPLIVDYRVSIREMIEAANFTSLSLLGLAASHRDYTRIGQLFPIEFGKVTEYEGKLIAPPPGKNPQGFHSLEDAQTAIAALDEHRPWQPAKLEHLLAFVEQYPDELVNEGFVAAIGSIVEVSDREAVPYAHANDSNYRGLQMKEARGEWIGAGRDRWFKEAFLAEWRFLAIRQK